MDETYNSKVLTDDLIEAKVITREEHFAKEGRISCLQMPLLSPAFKFFLVLLDFLIHIQICCNIPCL